MGVYETLWNCRSKVRTVNTSDRVRKKSWIPSKRNYAVWSLKHISLKMTGTQENSSNTVTKSCDWISNEHVNIHNMLFLFPSSRQTDSSQNKEHSMVSGKFLFRTYIASDYKVGNSESFIVRLEYDTTYIYIINGYLNSMNPF